MRYSEAYRTRWHDTDANRRVRPSQLLVYMQETSNHHVAAIGLPLDDLRDQKHLAFILSRMSLAIYHRPTAFETLEVQTWTNPSRGFSSERSFRVLCGERIVAEASSTWALLGTEDRKLHRPEETGYVFEDEEAVDTGLPARVRIPADLPLENLGERRIVYSDLDYNMHMNNTHYPDMLCDHLPLEDVDRIRGFTLSYLHEAAYGDRITVLRAKGEDCYYFRTLNEEGTVCLEARIQLNQA